MSGNGTDPRAAAAAAWAAAMEATTMGEGLSGSLWTLAVVVTVAHVVFILRIFRASKPETLHQFRWNVAWASAAGLAWLWGTVWDARTSPTPPPTPDALPSPAQCVGFGLWGTWVLGEGAAVALTLYRVCTTCVMTWATAYGSVLHADGPDDDRDTLLAGGDANVRIPTAADVPHPGDTQAPLCCGCIRAVGARHRTATGCRACIVVSLRAMMGRRSAAFACQWPGALLTACVPFLAMGVSAAVITFALPREEAFQADLASGCALADTARVLFTAALAAQAMYVTAVVAGYNHRVRDASLRYPAWFFLLVLGAVAADVALNAAAWATDVRDDPPFRATRVVAVAVLLCAFTAGQTYVQARAAKAAAAARHRRPRAAPPGGRQVEMVTVSLDDTDDAVDAHATTPGVQGARPQPQSHTESVSEKERRRLVAAVRGMSMDRNDSPPPDIPVVV